MHRCYFGVGINRPLEGEYLDLVQMLNNNEAVKISVDMPSGLPSETPADGEVFHADYTISFQFPKLALLFPEHAAYVGKLVVRNIGMEPKHFKPFPSEYWFFPERTCLPTIGNSMSLVIREILDALFWQEEVLGKWDLFV